MLLRFLLIAVAVLTTGKNGLTTAFTTSPMTTTTTRIHPATFFRRQPMNIQPLFASTTAVSSNELIEQSPKLQKVQQDLAKLPVQSILEKNNNNEGYYKAMETDSVWNVVKSMSTAAQDVALIYNDQSQLVGIFTEADYIKFSAQLLLQSQEEEEGTAISTFMTPSSDVVTLSASATVQEALGLISTMGVQHLVLTHEQDDQEEGDKLIKDTSVAGVLNLKNVMSMLQQDATTITAYLESTGSEEEQEGEEKVHNVQVEVIQNDEKEEVGEVDLGKRDAIRAGTAVLGIASLALFASQSSFLHDNANIGMIAIFCLGYLGIIFEEVFEFNKAAVALLMCTGLWVTYADFFQNPSGIATSSALSQLGEQLAEVSDICFFLLAASAIVEVVDAHEGFKVVTNQINTTSKKQLFWTIGFLTFFLSSILNNLTVTIVMCSLLKKIVPREEDRKLFGAMVVVAANAGGVWTPIGDVTTTMLWINQQLSTLPTITELFLPSIVCLVGSLAFLVNQVEEDEDGSSLAASSDDNKAPLTTSNQLVFWSGIASLLSVPVFNELTGLPPYLAMLTGLGVMWALTDLLHFEREDEEHLKVPASLAKLDVAGILFFLGILMSIGVLDKSGLLKELALFLNQNLPNLDIIATVIGIASALIDNVPLVAATMGMYDLTEYPMDDQLWQLIALCAGTGGSILVIGSASGVALMGLEKVDFLWYAKKVSIGATVGYFAGIATYLAQSALLQTFSNPTTTVAAAIPATMDALQQAVVI